MRKKPAVNASACYDVQANTEATATVGPYDRMHAQRAPDGRERGEDAKGTPPSNTVPQSYIDNLAMRVLRDGIDSLYLSFQGEIYPAIDHELMTLKFHAQSKNHSEQAKAQYVIHGHLFEVSDKGQKGFAYVLGDNDYRIVVSSGDSNRMPLAWVKISSECLTLKGVKPAVEELIKIISEIGEATAPSISRVDICVDFQTNYNFESIQRSAWVTRSRTIANYSEFDRFTGWTVGAGSPISMRLYDKITEIMKSGKAYMLDLWLSNGWETSIPVWRLEIQFKREVLSQLGVHDFDAMMNSLGGMWGYALQTWLRLTVPQEGDSNRARWPTHPIWELLASIKWRLDDQPLTRKYSPARIPSLDKVMQLYSSHLITFMAVKGITDYAEGVKRFQKKFEEFQKSRCVNKLNISFDEWIDAEVRLKGRQFNTINNRLNAPSGNQSIAETADACQQAKDGDYGDA